MTSEPLERIVMKNIFRTSALVACFIMLGTAYAAEEEHGDEHDEDEAGSIVLTAAERDAKGIRVTTVSKIALSESVRLPGEVVINAYRSARVTPRITAQVVSRHVQLGDSVVLGQRLVTLSSVEMAEAQGLMIVADREWLRVKNLGRGTVSESRYTEAEVARQQALARVLAYGMTEKQASALTTSGDGTKATGSFELLATRAGTILRDDFLVGELIEPGRVLFDITDESVLWVEAQQVATGLPHIETNAKARVSVDGQLWIEGSVIQRHHQLDETTRTRSLRIEVENAEDQLHPGQFVEVVVETGKRAPTLAIPKAAVTMIGGSPTVFSLEDGDEFHAETVSVGATVGDWVTINSGVETGDIVATDGVFHLKSLMLKSSLGEGHGH